MNANKIKLVACLAWAGAAISSATSANALAATQDTGDYATCTQNTYTYATNFCGYSFAYYQLIRFNQTQCGLTGGCSSDSFPGHVEFAYSSGRKTAALVTSCDRNIYGLGSCAC